MAMTTAVLTRLHRNADTDDGKFPLRDPEVSGYYPKVPEVGSRFVFYGEPRDPGGSLRVVSTSDVLEVKTVNAAIVFRTLNSTYRLDPVPEEKP